LLGSVPEPGSKGSTFDPTEVAALRSRRNRPRAGRLDATILSAITQIADQHIRVRGYDLVELACTGATYEAVATLLWTGELRDSVTFPKDPSLVSHAALAHRALPESAPLIDRLRINVAIASAWDDLRHDRRTESVVRAAPSLVAAMVDGLPSRRDTDGGLAERLWAALTTQRPTARWIDALNATLVLAADHDLAASTFAARVAASTRADPYAVVGAGLGAFGGNLHGAASKRVHRLLVDAQRGRVAGAVGAALAGEQRMEGFGQFLYPDGDPRGRAVLDFVRAASPAPARLAVCESVRDLVQDRTGIASNIDFALAALTFCTGMREDAGEAIFAISRSAGWIAHAVEEYGEAPLRFRAVARYVGPSGPTGAVPERRSR
ncbi:MAG TPA: citrate/2-methylcitrate synthase, partial [Acidimicrobiales bacterium]|nr:citrate/2-methylcitrate synthase [Acidimicrobiales bacterium]